MLADTLFRRTLIFLSATLCAMGVHSIGHADASIAHQLIADAVNQFDKVDNYTCRLDKRVRKADGVHDDRDIFVKYKKPGHYYFRWNSGMARGREVIFVQGSNNGKIVAHPGGIFKLITLRLDPEGPMAMRENRHSLKSSGMEKIIALIKSNTALANTEGLDAIRFIGENRFDGKRVQIVEGCFPEGHGFYAYRIRLYVCPSIKLPLKVSIYDWSGQLVEDYEFHDLKINVRLSEDDFDPRNPQYDYVTAK